MASTYMIRLLWRYAVVAYNVVARQFQKPEFSAALQREFMNHDGIQGEHAECPALSK